MLMLEHPWGCKSLGSKDFPYGTKPFSEHGDWENNKCKYGWCINTITTGCFCSPQMLEKGNLSGEGWILLNHCWVVSCTFCSFIFGPPFSSICTGEWVHRPEPSMVTHCRWCWKGSYYPVISVFPLFSQASRLTLDFTNRLPCFVFCCFHNTPYKLFGKLPLWFFPLTS